MDERTWYHNNKPMSLVLKFKWYDPLSSVYLIDSAPLGEAGHHLRHGLHLVGLLGVHELARLLLRICFGKNRPDHFFFTSVEDGINKMRSNSQCEITFLPCSACVETWESFLRDCISCFLDRQTPRPGIESALAASSNV